MKKIFLLVPIVVLLAAGCGSSQPQNNPTPVVETPTTQTQNPTPSPTPTPVVTPTPTKASSDTTDVINVALETQTTATLGTVLTASNGLTLYTSNADQSGVSNCTGNCASSWPPYTVPASDVAKGLVGVVGVNGKIGSITRADGSKQVTYNGKPLYFWVSDVNPGDTTGNMVNGFVVVKP